MMVNSRSNDSALARKGMLSSKAASNVRRATPVTDRCQPRSAFTRRVRPPPRGPPAWRRGGDASPRSAAARSRRGRWAPPPRRRLGYRAARPARPPSRPRDRACALDTELLEQEREGLLEVARDRGADVGGQIPHAPLERLDRFLAALVVELLLRVPLLPLVLALRFHPLLELAPQLGRQLRVVEHDVLEIGREVDFNGLALGEVAERVGRQRRGAVLHRTAQAVLAARVSG